MLRKTLVAVMLVSALGSMASHVGAGYKRTTLSPPTVLFSHLTKIFTDTLNALKQCTAAAGLRIVGHQQSPW